MANFRPELQGLRAIAVALVLGFHLVPGAVRGGFVGVDVFFVLSGFLITRMLLDEAEARRRISVPRFLFRRARRLLPAAGLVLVATAVAAIVLLPRFDLAREALHVIASTLQVENWLLASEASDYFAQGSGSTTTQQFWTLSVEWQVYLGWAILVALAVRQSTRRLAVIAGAVILASLACCVWLTAGDPTLAYFATQARAWEFALGGLVAITLPFARLPARRRAVLGWLGVIAIVTGGIAFGADDYPGLIALVPTLGAALVVAAAAPAELAWRPLVWLGDRSYAIYLWHWPLLVLFTELRDAPGPFGALAIAAASVALAAVTKILIEDPPRRSRRTPLVAVVIIASVLAPLAVSGTALAQISTHVESLTRTSVEGYPGAAAIDPVDAALVEPRPIQPDPLVASDDVGDVGDGHACLLALSAPVTCDFGDLKATRTVAIVGDSHAWQLVPLLDTFGIEEHWHVVTYAKPSCPFTPVPVTRHGVELLDCAEWREGVFQALAADPPELVVVAALTPWGYEFVDYTAASVREQADGYGRYWARLTELGIPVVAVADTPYMAISVPECVDTHRDDPSLCDQSRSAVFHEDPLVTAQAENPAVGLIDLSGGICRVSVCPAVVGNVLVYRDAHHLTATYSRTLEPMFARQLAALGY